MRHSNGDYVWMVSRGQAVLDMTGKVYRIAGSQTDITTRKFTEDQLAYNSFHDGLTKLPNRRLFLDRL